MCPGCSLCLLVKQEQNMVGLEQKMAIILGQNGFTIIKAVFEVQDFYAIVKYYLVYEFEESKVMLAYVQ
ncbi:5065_t:CDS:2 [Racocetra persica]|uniref:5065_t:CDS:1 n=1 Tax=Racocetra persica TaxID=160502 RepID=A0ACA9QVT6_9GLOM|nr:5065_t:CDS:2 [Racocetra persica]